MTIRKQLGDLVISKFARDQVLAGLTNTQKRQVFTTLAQLFVYKFAFSYEYQEDKIIKLFKLEAYEKFAFINSIEHLKKFEFLTKQLQTNTQRAMTKINTILDSKTIKDVGYSYEEPLNSEVYYMERSPDDKVPHNGLKIFKRKQTGFTASRSHYRNKDIEFE